MDAGADRPSSVAGGAGARERLLAAAVAVAAGALAYLLAVSVFQYHSSNHDEAVYLQQASMLLAGQLELRAGELAGAFRPWFFVEDGGRLYPKYQPYPAVLYAAAMGLFGAPRVALAFVAAANAALVYLLGAEAVDRRVGVVAAAVFAAAPLSVVTTAVFLPYAPTTTLNLTFAVLYLRGVRRAHLPSAAGAGLAVGLAFFGRPFTALLFAAPFVLHALVEVGESLRADGLRPLPAALRRNLLTAAGGLAFVGLSLAYNARVTGAPLRFAYEAFAPRDGPGFGHREILGHSLEYTPALAAETNAYLLWYFATRWFTLGAAGTACALAGVALVACRLRAGSGSDVVPAVEPPAAWTLGGLCLSVPLGNVAFWGNYNVLGTMTDPTDGLVSQFGPFYHFDLLVPLSVFAAVALVSGYRLARGRLIAGRSPETARLAVAIGLVVSLPAVGVANAGLAAQPLERNAAHTDRYEAAYAPFENESLDDALVFVPTPYGEWQHHPFQSLRNDPGFDGPVVYALDRDPGEDFAVLDAYPGRERYRYTYRGEWTPNADRHVTPKLEPLETREGERLAATTTVGVPDRVDRARVRLATDDGHQERAVEDPGDRLTVEWELAGDGARLRDGGAPLAVDGTGAVVLTVTLVATDGSTFTYRQEAAVRAGGDRVEAVWPPDRTVCPLVTDCGREGTYLPDRPDEHREWVVFETRLETGG